MSGRGWIILLVAVGVGLAILIGILGSSGGESQAEAEQSLCASLSSLETATSDLTSLDPATASPEDYQTAVSDIGNDWTRVEADAKEVTGVSVSTLDDAWNEFQQAVEGVPSDASQSDAIDDVSQAAQSLSSATKSTIGTVNCS